MAGPRMIPEYRKQYGMGGEESYTKPTKAPLIERITKHPAVLVRGKRDDLIIWDKSKEEPRLMWLVDALEVMDIGELIILAGLVDKIADQQKGK